MQKYPICRGISVEEWVYIIDRPHPPQFMVPDPNTIHLWQNKDPAKTLVKDPTIIIIYKEGTKPRTLPPTRSIDDRRRITPHRRAMGIEW